MSSDPPQSPSRRALKAARGGVGGPSFCNDPAGRAHHLCSLHRASSSRRERQDRVSMPSRANGDDEWDDQENQENQENQEHHPRPNSARQTCRSTAPVGWAAHRKPVAAANHRAALEALKRMEATKQRPEGGGAQPALPRHRAPITPLSPKPKRKLSRKTATGATGTSTSASATTEPTEKMERARKRARR